MPSPDEMMDAILAKSNSVCMLATFSSIKKALDVLGRLSFAQPGPTGQPSLPRGMLCGVYKSDNDKGMVVIGGRLSADQRKELFDLVQAQGHVDGVTFSKPRQWWQLWR